MKLNSRARSSAPETIVALIDVVLFLLVFFMLIGRMDATAPFQLMPPVADSGLEMPGGGATVSISVTGNLALNGAPMDHTALLAGLKQALVKTPGLLVRIDADRGAELRDLLPLVSEIDGLGTRNVVLVVTPGPP